MMKLFVIFILAAILMKSGNAKTTSGETKDVGIDTKSLDSKKSARDILPMAKQHKRSTTSATIYAIDMGYTMRKNVLRYARWIIRNRSTTNYAKYMKTLMDKNHNGGYNCIVGTSYRFSISYNRGYYIFFEMNGYYFTVYRKR